MQERPVSTPWPSRHQARRMLLGAFMIAIVSYIVPFVTSMSVWSFLQKSLGYELGWHMPCKHSDYVPEQWLMMTHNFTQNHYQAYPYVANGYFGQTLPAEGMGYWIQQNGTGPGAPLSRNDWPLDEPRATFGTIAGFWNLQNRTNRIIHEPSLERAGESVISGIPDWTGLIVTTSSGQSYVPGVDKATVKTYAQSMSLQDGIVQTNVTWLPEGESASLQLNYTILAHQTRINLGIVRLDLVASDDMDVVLTDLLDGHGSTRTDFFTKGKESAKDLIWTSVQPKGLNYIRAFEYSTVSIVMTGERLVQRLETPPFDVSQNASTVAQSWNVKLEAGSQVSIYKYVGIASTDAYAEAAQSRAMTTTIEAQSTSWGDLMRSHKAAWEKVWDDVDITVPSHPEVQKMARASMFHLLANIRAGTEGHGIGDISVSPSGMSSDSYGGYIFWDADTWVAPGLLALYPDRALNINNYRYRLHNQALANSQANGLTNFSGAMYPWTSARTGKCTGNGLCAGYQYHLNADIALAHWNYYLHTKDKAWLRGKGWPVIFNAAQFFVSYVQWSLAATNGKVWTHILADPDEDNYMIDNGAYTNVQIKLLLGTWGPAAAKVLGISTPSVWKEIADEIFIPMNDNNDVMLEFNGMRGDIIIKQADIVLLSYPLEYEMTEKLARNNLDYYTPRNNPNGPQMTWSVHAIIEAQLQQSGCAAYTYMEHGWQPYHRGPFYQFSELRLDDSIFNDEPAFPFVTGYGGFLQIFTHGWTGMRARIDMLHLDPSLPPHFGSGGVQVFGIKWQGAVLDIDIGLQTTKVTYRSKVSWWQSARPITIFIPSGSPGAGKYMLSSGKTLEIPTRRPDLENKDNVALCQPVFSSHPCTLGNLPLGAVDGSPSTFWQPESTDSASLVFDLGVRQSKIEHIEILWGAVPPVGLRIEASDDNTDWQYRKVFELKNVEISAPYEHERVAEVRLLEGNKTQISLQGHLQARFVKLFVWGTQGPDNTIGATVAEFKVLGL